MPLVVLYDACVLYPAPVRDLLIRINGWRATAKKAQSRQSKALKDIFDDTWIARKLKEARHGEADVFISVVLLTSAKSRKGVAFVERELGDSQAREGGADFMRRVRRLALLEHGERLERIMVRLAHAAPGWTATATPDPVRRR